MANINRQWKKFMCVGCSHGHLINWKVAEAACKIRQEFKPARTFHLGDFTDQSALRSGAKGTADEAVSLFTDTDASVRFLRMFEPTDALIGNHDARAWELRNHHNAIVARAAGAVVEEIYGALRKLKANFVDHYDIRKSWIELGDTKLVHGWMYGENALRDHAEHFGKVIMAHKHILAKQPGRRVDSPDGWCVGLIADIDKLSYAHRRRATSQWQNGLIIGEYSDTEVTPWLVEIDPLGNYHLGL